jgi:membrane associated rhomboid family serine protease
MLNNIPPVTKNILILNILFYVATMIMGSKGVDLISMLGAHYLNTPLFEPYQVVTHFFMHAPGIFHILFNMLMLVMFGSHLERIWGAQRFFIFYIVSALGAFALYNGIGMYQVIQLKAEIKGLGYDIVELNNYIKFKDEFLHNPADEVILAEYVMKSMVPMVGASGAIFGIMAAFAYLFPNTELMLLFPPIPIKAKYLIGGYFVLEVFLGFKDYSGDNIAHFAHVGGAIAGFILVMIWNRNKKTFY